MLYNIIQGDCPVYLKEHIPILVGNVTRYPLRNCLNYRQIECHSTTFKKSFFVSGLNHWNNIDLAIRDLPSVSAFTNVLYPKKERCSKWLSHGVRWLNIIHCKLRMKCSSLAVDLKKLHIIQVDDSGCQCGHPEEDCLHFLSFSFFRCRP